MKKAPNCYAQAGAFLDIGSRSFNKVGCGVCAQLCPSGAIKVEGGEEE